MNKLLALALTVAFSSVVSANEIMPADVSVNDTAPVEFQSLDTNIDGVITLAEIQGEDALKLAFTELDLDKNGELSEDEYSKFSEVAK